MKTILTLTLLFGLAVSSYAGNHEGTVSLNDEQMVVLKEYRGTQDEAQVWAWANGLVQGKANQLNDQKTRERMKNYTAEQQQAMIDWYESDERVS